MSWAATWSPPSLSIVLSAAYPDFERTALEPGRMVGRADPLRFLLDIYHRAGIGGESRRG